ncbi:MAG: BON domain-containing protein [Candidatus Binatia bacterium]
MSATDSIITQVRAALEREPRINLHRYPVEVSVSNGDFVLAGEVEHIVAKKLVLELAARTPGVGTIVDRIRVAPAQPMGDGAVRDHIRDAFLQESTLTNCMLSIRDKGQTTTVREASGESSAAIEVQVEDGVVTLNGQVPSLSHKRIAGVLAWWVPGSRDVVNGLEVLPPMEDRDEEMTEAVNLVLKKNPFVDASQIRVSTHNSVVTLDGLVTNETEKRMAEFDAWYIFGVDAVMNQLAVRE